MVRRYDDRRANLPDGTRSTTALPLPTDVPAALFERLRVAVMAQPQSPLYAPLYLTPDRGRLWRIRPTPAIVVRSPLIARMAASDPRMPRQCKNAP